MLVYHNEWDGKPSFKMLPIEKKCPYVEAIYDPATKVLVVINKSHKNTPHMFPVLDLSGKQLPNREERIMTDTYYEHYIENMDDIKAFVQHFANNRQHEALKMLE